MEDLLRQEEVEKKMKVRLRLAIFKIWPARFRARSVRQFKKHSTYVTFRN